MAVSITMLNCQGLRSAVNRQTLFQWLNCFGPDVVCLQETHSVSENEFADWVSDESQNGNNTKAYSCVSSPGLVRSSGVAILYRKSLSIVQSFKDTDGRLVGCEVKYNDYHFQVACVYGPNNKAAGSVFFESLYQALDPDVPAFLCGDFNMVLDPVLDRFGNNPNSYWAYNWSGTLSALMSAYDLNDVWWAKHPGESEYTWRRPNGAQGSRIDMIWMPKDLISNVEIIKILPFFWSDHGYVHMKINLPLATERGPGAYGNLTSRTSTIRSFVPVLLIFGNNGKRGERSFPFFQHGGMREKYA